MLLQRWEAKIGRKEKLPQPGIKLTTIRSWVQHAHHLGEACYFKVGPTTTCNKAVGSLEQRSDHVLCSLTLTCTVSKSKWTQASAMQRLRNTSLSDLSFANALTLYHTILTFNNPERERFWKHCEKRRKCCKQHFLLFSQCFLPFQKQVLIFLLPIQ